MNELIPIDTEYKGYFFRSRTEARYAVYLDHLGWSWDYEYNAYPTIKGAYLPDFWINDLKCFSEVKPYKMSQIELEKCLDLSKQMNTETDHVDFILFEGQVDWKAYRTVSNGVLSQLVVPAKIKSRYYPFCYTDAFSRKLMPEEWIAVKKGRQCRFEFEWKEIAPNG